MKKENKSMYIVLAVVLVVFIVLSILIVRQTNEPVTDNVKFSSEYTLVGENNVFVIRDINQIINILEHGTGVVFLGFPACGWCQQYAVYLNEAAIENGVPTIYYFNIYEDRTNNTDEYQKIVSLLGDNLAYNKEGNKHVFVPDVTFVVKGEIIGHDNESSYDVTGEPSDYWTDYKISDLKNRLKVYMEQVVSAGCSECEG